MAAAVITTGVWNIMGKGVTVEDVLVSRGTKRGIHRYDQVSSRFLHLLFHFLHSGPIVPGLSLSVLLGTMESIPSFR